MVDSSAACAASEEDLAKSEELKNKANEFFKGRIYSTRIMIDYVLSENCTW